MIEISRDEEQGEALFAGETDFDEREEHDDDEERNRKLEVEQGYSDDQELQLKHDQDRHGGKGAGKRVLRTRCGLIETTLDSSGLTIAIADQQSIEETKHKLQCKDEHKRGD